MNLPVTTAAYRHVCTQCTIGPVLTKFHVLDSTGAIVGSINVANEQVSDLLKCWRDSAPAPVNKLARSTRLSRLLSGDRAEQGSDFARLLT